MCEASLGREDESVSHISGEVWGWPVELDPVERIERECAVRGIVFLEASEVWPVMEYKPVSNRAGFGEGLPIH